MAQYKEILLNTMKSFMNFCENHGIQYVAAYGTVLGAVRHKGVIPWDDDIDVIMDRANYEKFLSLRKNTDLGNYEIIDIHNEGYYLPYAKFCDARTTIWEVKTFPFVIGVFVDVFPIDEVSLNEEDSYRMLLRYKETFGRYQQSLKHYELKNVLSLRGLKSFLKTICYSKKRLKKKLVALESVVKNYKGEYRMCYISDLPFERAKMKKIWFDNYIEAPYEDFKIRIPEDFDGFLKQCYGDYMQLPPEEKRVSQHFHYFVDLEHRLTIEEIKKIKNGK